MHCEYLLEMPDIKAVLSSIKQFVVIELRTGYRNLPLSFEWRFSWSTYMFQLIKKKKKIAKKNINNMKTSMLPSTYNECRCLYV